MGGDLDFRLNIQTGDEIEQVADAFNKMAGDLFQSHRALEQNISQLEKSKAEADSANQAKSVFLANMSHELRTPLNAILGFSQIMGQDKKLSNKHLDELRIINNNGEHLLRLINDILEMSKIEAGQVILNNTKILLSQLLGSLDDMLRYKAESKGISFRFSYPSHLHSYICIDAQKLRQVLINLLDNAIKFTDDGHVSLRINLLHSSDSQASALANGSKTNESSKVLLYFEVEDSGCGIDETEIDLLFQPFAQTSSGRLSQEGSGLGLPISSQFVQLMGGKLKVDSQPGVGSIFSFLLPATVTDTSEADEVLSQKPAIKLAPNQVNYRILVVDDNWENRTLLHTQLTKLGFDVKTATNGQEAIACWKSWRPNLIFMDMRMPVMDGLESSRQIREIEASRVRNHETYTRIIAITAEGISAGKESEAIAAGCDDFRLKPIREGEISQILSEQLGVSFIYESDETNASFSTSTNRLSTTELKSLSEEWVLQLQNALINLDLDRMLLLVDGIPAEKVDLAERLSQKIHNFEYEYLLELIQDALTS